MNHWEIAGSMAAEHRSDLDREAVRAGRAALVRAAHPALRRTWRSVVAGWLQALRTGSGYVVRRSVARREAFAGKGR